MSLDSTQRINDFFEAQLGVGTTANIYTIYVDKNEDLPDDLGGGTFVKISTEASFDDETGTSLVNELYTERGIVIFEVLAPVGLGNNDLYSHAKITTLIRDTFRNKSILPTGTEEGTIYFEDMSAVRSFRLPQRQGVDYMVKNIFINYQKSYNVAVS